jgi:hypothetical protein
VTHAAPLAELQAQPRHEAFQSVSPDSFWFLSEDAYIEYRSGGQFALTEDSQNLFEAYDFKQPTRTQLEEEQGGESYWSARRMEQDRRVSEAKAYRVQALRGDDDEPPRLTRKAES